MDQTCAIFVVTSALISLAVPVLVMSEEYSEAANSGRLYLAALIASIHY
jgi:hypothetical protein